MQKVLIILLSFFVCISFKASAQYYNFQNYTVEDGLPQSQVFSLHQDERSNIWLGTNGGGLARFNGRDFEVFRRNDGLISHAPWHWLYFFFCSWPLLHLQRRLQERQNRAEPNQRKGIQLVTQKWK